MVWKLSRRELLAGGGALAGAAVVGGVWKIQPQRVLWSRPDPAAAARFTKPFHVCVIGGGLAGLSAALELSERGAQVTLLEAAPHVGGKLGGWPVKVNGETFAMEHGFHGFFTQYYNLNDCLQRIKATGHLQPTTSYPILFAERGEEHFSSAKYFFPLNLLNLYARSPSLHWASMLPRNRETQKSMQTLLAYDSVKTFAQLDDISFADFAATLDPGLYRGMLLPFAKTTLNRPERVSAAYALMFMHFYFLGNPEGLGYRFTDTDAMTAIIDPWVARLRNNGVLVRTHARVSSLEVKDGAVVAVHLGESAERVVATMPAQLSGPVEIGRDGEVPIFAIVERGRAAAVRGACTHMGCPVRLASTGGGFACPCHGGRFDAAGAPTGGPPQHPLERLHVRADGTVIVPTAAGERIACDAVVLASDVRGTRRIVAASSLAPQLAAQVAALAEAEPYLVVRLWLDRRANPERDGFYTVSGFALLDAVAVYDHLQSDYRNYADRSGHSVVEIHAYAIPAELDRGLDANVEALFAELQQALPELKGARIVHMEAMQQSNFSGFAPGSHAARPPSATPHRNLFLAGDWVRCDFPVALMEAAVASGRVAANGILTANGVATAPIETVLGHGAIPA